MHSVKKIAEPNAVSGGFLERSNQLIEKKKRLTQVRNASLEFKLVHSPKASWSNQSIHEIYGIFVFSKKKSENKRKPVLCPQ